MYFDEIAQLSDDDARTYIEQIRWPRGPVCSHCGGSGATRLQGGSTRPGLFKCRNKTCRKQFTVTTGTPLADTHLSIRIWLQVVALMRSQFGISAHALHRRCNIRTYKSARRVCERIQRAKDQPPLAKLLARACEAEGLDFTLPPEFIELFQSYGGSTQKNKPRRRGPTGRHSLYPLSFDDALRGLLPVPPMGRRPKSPPRLGELHGRPSIK